MDTIISEIHTPFWTYTHSIIILILIIWIVFYIKRRTKSGFFISNLLWGFVVRNKNKQDDFINEIIEIEKFNFFYNTYATSKREKEKFESWI